MGWNKKGGGMDDFFDILFTLIGGFFIFFFLFGVIDNLTKDNEDITIRELNTMLAKSQLLSALSDNFNAQGNLASNLIQNENIDSQFNEITTFLKERINFDGTVQVKEGEIIKLTLSLDPTPCSNSLVIPIIVPLSESIQVIFIAEVGQEKKDVCPKNVK